MVFAGHQRRGPGARLILLKALQRTSTLHTSGNIKEMMAKLVFLFVIVSRFRTLVCFRSNSLYLLGSSLSKRTSSFITIITVRAFASVVIQISFFFLCGWLLGLFSFIGTLIRRRVFSLNGFSCVQILHSYFSFDSVFFFLGRARPVDTILASISKKTVSACALSLMNGKGELLIISPPTQMRLLSCVLSLFH